LPIIPPSVARFWVDGSGPNRSPWGRAAACSELITTPGSTTAVRASGSISPMAVRCVDVSTTIPGPIALPATDVPPPRSVSGVPVVRATSATARRSSVSRGKTTTCGTTR
jgi:hypothetical protein